MFEPDVREKPFQTPKASLNNFTAKTLYPYLTLSLNISFSKMWTLISCYKSLQCFQAFHVILEAVCRDMLTFSHQNISKVTHWRWAIKPGFTQHSGSSQTCWTGLGAQQWSSSTLNWENHFFYGPFFLHWVSVMLIQESGFPKLTKPHLKYNSVLYNLSFHETVSGVLFDGIVMCFL